MCDPEGQRGFWLSQLRLGVRVLLSSSGRGQRCWQTSHKAKNCPTPVLNKELSSLYVNSGWENLIHENILLSFSFLSLPPLFFLLNCNSWMTNGAYFMPRKRENATDFFLQTRYLVHTASVLTKVTRQFPPNFYLTNGITDFVPDCIG